MYIAHLYPGVVVVVDDVIWPVVVCSQVTYQVTSCSYCSSSLTYSGKNIIIVNILICIYCHCYCHAHTAHHH